MTKSNKRSVDDIIEDIRKVEDFQALKRLKQTIKSICDEKEEQLFKANVKDLIDKNGYYITNDEHINIEGVTSQRVNLYVDLRAFDKEDHSDACITGIADKQDKWQKYFNYNYEEEDYDDLYFAEESDWDCGDWDDPDRAIGSVTIFIYYKPLRIPIPIDTNCRVTAFDIDFDKERILQKSKCNNNWLIETKNGYAWSIDDINNWYIKQVDILELDDAEIDKKVQERQQNKEEFEAEYDCTASSSDDDTN